MAQVGQKIYELHPVICYKNSDIKWEKMATYDRIQISNRNLLTQNIFWEFSKDLQCQS